MKKIYLKRLLEFAGFFIILFFSLVILGKLFTPKWIKKKDNYEKYLIDSFYREEKNSIDLIFLGNSDSYYGIYPMELYKDYGITSFVYAKPGGRVWIDYYNLKNVLLSQKPKYLFYSVDDVFSVKPSRNGDVMKSILGMEPSINKLNAIMDNNVQKKLALKLTYVFPVIRFHSRYNELNSDDFKYTFGKAYSPTKGVVVSDDVRPYKYGNYMNKRRKVELIPETNRKYLDKIVDICNKNNIKLVFYELPSADSWGYKRHEEVKKYATEKNIPFIDMNVGIDKVDINWNVDSRDGGDHLNVLGALKTTKYIGEYIKNNLDLEDHRNDKRYERWDTDYIEYQKMKEKALYEVQKVKS